MAGAAAGATDDLRFEIRSALGQGGTGVVYRAFDRRLGREVALKVLRHGSGRDLYRFKREFRGIADLVHPNLIGLHELHTTGDDWFFTMDLVDGVSFMEWVRPAPEPRSATWDGDDDGTTETATRRQPRSRAASKPAGSGATRGATGRTAVTVASAALPPSSDAGRDSTPGSGGRTHSTNGTPSTRSMVKNQLSPVVCSSWSVTRFGWMMPATARNSRLKRYRSPPLAWRTTLSATSRPSRRSSAR